MALRVLDGNQTATTLSSVVTGGEHIVAHSVVSLGANAIANITSAVSGSVVSISNFPATQPISGSVSISGTPSVTFSAVSISNFPATQTIAGTVTANIFGYNQQQVGFTPIPLRDDSNDQTYLAVGPSNRDNPQDSKPIPVINEVGGLLAISGTVTANVPLIRDEVLNNSSVVYPVSGADVNTIRTVIYSSSGNGFDNDDGRPVDIDNPLPISGTVTVGNSVTIGSLPAISGTVTVGNSVTIGSLPAISGTVTANVVGTRTFVDGNAVTVSGFLAVGGWDAINAQYAPIPLNDLATGVKVSYDSENGVPVKVEALALPSGALTTRFGSVTTANTAQITSAVTNTSRKYLLAQNISAGTVTIGIGFSPTTTQGIQLTAGGGLTFDAFCPTGAIFWLGAVTGAAYTILEG